MDVYVFLQVTTECESRMVGDHMDVLHAECRPMVAKEQRDDLANMYKLLKPIKGAQKVLLDELQAHVKAQGLQAIEKLNAETVRKQMISCPGVFYFDVLIPRWRRTSWRMFSTSTVAIATWLTRCSRRTRPSRRPWTGP